MSVEPTSALDYDGLILEVAIFLSVAYYGAAGDTAAVIPVDVVDLATCKRHVNNGIRMLIANAPAVGWRWIKPTASVVLWPAVELDDDVTATGVYDSSTYTVITASEATFYPSMEGKSIVVTGTDTYTIHTYVSSTVVWILGDNAFAGKTFSIAANGNYTMPRTFGGSYTGDITFAVGTDTGSHIAWGSESQVRQLREPTLVDSGWPSVAAIRRMDGVARRWELMVYVTPSEEMTVEFPYDLHFDSLSAGTDYHPAGTQHDEVVKAACKAVAEADSDDTPGPKWNYYRNIALPDAYKVDARSAPRRLGQTGRRLRLSENDHRELVQRPTVTVNS